MTQSTGILDAIASFAPGRRQGTSGSIEEELDARCIVGSPGRPDRDRGGDGLTAFLRYDFRLAQVFTISRGSRTEAKVLTAHLSAGGVTGRGECVPYARYGETLESVEAEIAGLSGDLTREGLQDLLPPGAVLVKQRGPQFAVARVVRQGLTEVYEIAVQVYTIGITTAVPGVAPGVERMDAQDGEIVGQSGSESCQHIAKHSRAGKAFDAVGSADHDQHPCGGFRSEPGAVCRQRHALRRAAVNREVASPGRQWCTRQVCLPLGARRGVAVRKNGR